MAGAARGIKRISLELGGKSPFVVFADSDLDAAVEWIMFGIFWNQGQVCSATSRVLVEAPLHDALVARLGQAAAPFPSVTGATRGSSSDPWCRRASATRSCAPSRRDRGRGAARHRGRASGRAPEGLFRRADDLLPTCRRRRELWREEVFGPVVCVRPFASEAEAVRIANDSRYGLAAAVMSADHDRAERVARAFRAGIVWINCSQPTFVEAPWGGVKQSGLGRELGRWGYEACFETKQITRYDSAEPWGWYLGG